MTDPAEQAAKKITIYCETHWPVGPNNWYSEVEPYIAAALREYGEACARLCLDNCEHTHSMIKAEAYRSALEEAAKVAESEDNENKYDKELLKASSEYSLPRERDFIAKSIRALLKPEEKGRCCIHCGQSHCGCNVKPSAGGER